MTSEKLDTAVTVAGEIVDQAYTDLSPWLDTNHDPYDVVEAIRKAILAALSARPAPDEHPCPICAIPFKTGDECASDIELGMCHAACLEGSPVVNLDTGEQRDGPITTYPYEADVAASALASQPVETAVKPVPPSPPALRTEEGQ